MGIEPTSEAWESLQFKLDKRWIGVICDDLNGSKWQTMENGKCQPP